MTTMLNCLCYSKGEKKMIKNNRIKKWSGIYIQKYSRRFLSFILIQNDYKEVELLNVHSMIVEFIDNLFWALCKVVLSQKNMIWMLSVLGCWGEQGKIVCWSCTGATRITVHCGILGVIYMFIESIHSFSLLCFLIGQKSLILYYVIAYLYVHPSKTDHQEPIWPFDFLTARSIYE